MDVNIPQVSGDSSLDIGLEDMTLKEEHTSHDNNVIMVTSDDNVDVKDMPGLTKEQVDKSCTSDLPSGTSQAPSTVASHAKPGSFCSIKNIKETSPLHLRNRILSGDYFLPCSPPDFALKHRCQEVKMLYDISLQSPCAATYQQCVDHGSGTNCFEVPDPWSNLQLLWDVDTPCNQLPNIWVSGDYTTDLGEN